VVAVVMALGAWPSWRASRARLSDDRAVEHRPSGVVARVAGAGAPPSVVIGVRHALERGRGSSSVPVGSALFGTSLAVLALCATAVFGASLAHLTTTPPLYGDDYQILFGNNANQAGPDGELATLQHMPAVDRIMLGTRDEVSINGVSVYGLAGKAVRGQLMLSVVRGRLPRADGDVILGTTTMRQVGARLGSSVKVTFQLPGGGTRTVAFRAVGVASFPGQFGLGGLGVGAAFTWSGYVNADCQPGSIPAACEQAFLAGRTPAVMVSATPDAAGHAAIARLTRQFGSSFAQPPTTPTSLVNFGEAVNFPLILGVALALFGAATLLHLLVVSSMRRRRENHPDGRRHPARGQRPGAGAGGLGDPIVTGGAARADGIARRTRRTLLRRHGDEEGPGGHVHRRCVAVTPWPGPPTIPPAAIRPGPTGGARSARGS
jgi:hypothetical protein